VAFVRGDVFDGFDLYTMSADGTGQQLVREGRIL
jgi:hypothetical protein